MKNGIYFATFGTGTDAGGGLITIRDGVLNGGDQWFLYRGVLLFNGDNFESKLRITQYQGGNTSVFGNVGDFELSLVGRFVDGDDARPASIQGIGTTTIALGVKLNFGARLIGELAEA